MAEQMWTKEELLKSLEEEGTIEKLREFIPKLLSRLYVEGLSYGNLSSQGEYAEKRRWQLATECNLSSG